MSRLYFTYDDYDTVSMKLALEDANSWCHELDRTVKCQAQERDDLQAQVYRLQDQLAQRKSQRSEISHWYQWSQQYKQSWSDEIKRNKATVDKLSREGSAFEQGKQKAESELRICLSNLRQKETEKAEIRAEADRVLQGKATLIESINDLRSEVRSIQEQRDMLLQEKVTLSMSVDDLRSEVRSLQEQGEMLQSAIDESKIQFERSSDELRHEKMRNSALQTRISNLELVEAQLRQSISTCWLHRFRSWVRRFCIGSTFLRLFLYLKLSFSSFGLWAKRLAGLARSTVGGMPFTVDVYSWTHLYN